MFCVLVNSFAPSSAFESLVKAFLQLNYEPADTPVAIMAKCELTHDQFEKSCSYLDCTAKLEVLITQGARGKILTIGEIETASVSFC